MLTHKTILNLSDAEAANKSEAVTVTITTDVVSSSNGDNSAVTAERQLTRSSQNGALAIVLPCMYVEADELVLTISFLIIQKWKYCTGKHNFDKHRRIDRLEKCRGKGHHRSSYQEIRSSMTGTKEEPWPSKQSIRRLEARSQIHHQRNQKPVETEPNTTKINQSHPEREKQQKTENPFFPPMIRKEQYPSRKRGSDHGPRSPEQQDSSRWPKDRTEQPIEAKRKETAEGRKKRAKERKKGKEGRE
ncbi:hypothetical protein V6N11_049259 [Hibiscus sabdariffa]|uniref:Uncharacterized protein n=1 Tax=Hibiscus sabdariffa TaxID=183260 RepID=A0ABR2P0M9_9ROSI